MLVLAAVADLVLAALLIGISGFVFGGGPEGMNGEPGAVIMWTSALIAALGAPIAGLVLLRRRRAGLGALVAWLPPAAAAIFGFLPIHPY